MTEQKHDDARGASSSNEMLESMAWAAFSAHSGVLQRNELDRWPGLRAAWSDWLDAWLYAWNAATKAEREACAQTAAVALRHYTGAVTGVVEAIRMRSNASNEGPAL